MGRPFKCPWCQSTDTTGKGVRKTKSMGVRRIRRCRDCGRKFTPKHQQFVDAPAGADSGTREDPTAERPMAPSLSCPDSSPPP